MHFAFVRPAVTLVAFGMIAAVYALPRAPDLSGDGDLSQDLNPLPKQVLLKKDCPTLSGPPVATQALPLAYPGSDGFSMLAPPPKKPDCLTR